MWLLRLVRPRGKTARLSSLIKFLFHNLLSSIQANFQQSALDVKWFKRTYSLLFKNYLSPFCPLFLNVFTGLFLSYGVTIPRLGKIWFRRCLAIGSVYFILVTMEGMARVHNPRFHTTQFVLATLFPLMCLDAAIMWWIFVYLARTLRETRLRHSLIKHNLYRNFSYVLVIVSLGNLIFVCSHVISCSSLNLSVHSLFRDPLSIVSWLSFRYCCLSNLIISFMFQ